MPVDLITHPAHIEVKGRVRPHRISGTADGEDRRRKVAEEVELLGQLGLKLGEFFRLGAVRRGGKLCYTVGGGPAQLLEVASEFRRGPRQDWVDDFSSKRVQMKFLPAVNRCAVCIRPEHSGRKFRRF